MKTISTSTTAAAATATILDPMAALLRAAALIMTAARRKTSPAVRMYVAARIENVIMPPTMQSVLAQNVGCLELPDPEDRTTEERHVLAACGALIGRIMKVRAAERHMRRTAITIDVVAIPANDIAA